MAGRLVERGLLGVLALSEVSDGGGEKASCKVRIPLLPSDRVNRTFSESRMVKTLWIRSPRCRPRVDVEMSTLQVGDSGLGEGDEGGAGPGLLLGVGNLQCRPRVDEGEAEVWDVVDTREGDDFDEAFLQELELLGELQSSDCRHRGR